jgi:hypothetical protein
MSRKDELQRLVETFTEEQAEQVLDSLGQFGIRTETQEAQIEMVAEGGPVASPEESAEPGPGKGFDDQ